MTLRDYSQGAWRMRGIGAGQTLVALVPPVVASLITRHAPPCEHAGQDLLAWLLQNGIESEQLQFKQLCVQDLSHLYRRRAFNSLLATQIEAVKSREHVSRLSVRVRIARWCLASWSKP